MEEEKAAAYYEELLRKGEGAARFKQGLGFSSNSNSNKSSTSFSIPTSLSNFVKQSSPNSAPAIQKESSIFNIRDKLKKRPGPEGRTRSKDRPDRIGIGERRTVDGRNGRSRSPSSSADENKRSSRRVGRSRSPYRSHHGKRRSFSPHSPSPYYRRRDRSESPRRERNSPERRRDGGRRRRSRSRSMGRGRSRSRSKSRSPGSRHIRDREYNKSRTKPSQQKPAERDYAKLIPNYETMTPAEKVKAKMKLQLSETVVKDKEKGMTGEWERYDFDKNAPLDDDAKLDYFGDGTGARDDTSLIKNTGGSFLASSCQAKKEIKTQEAHEAAIFGIPMDLSTNDEDGSEDADANAFGNVKRSAKASSVVSEQVIASQQESWQERARKLKAAREMASA